MKQRMAPHNVEAEEAVLGSLLIDPMALERVRQILRSDEFYIQKNAWIYAACLELEDRGDPLDTVTLLDVLESHGQLTEVGGAAYISRLLNVVPSAMHVEAYARIVRDNAQRRRLLALASSAAQLAYNEDKHISEAIGNVRAELVRMATPETPGDVLIPAVQPLPATVALDEEMAQGAGTWLDDYIEYAERVAPMTPRLFHESAGLWLASLAIARRLVLPLAFDDIYPNLWVIWVAPTTIWSKTTAMNIARKMARRTMRFLLAPEELTPEAMLADMSGVEPNNLLQMPLQDQQNWQLRRNHAGQRGWTLDEFSGMLAGAGRDYNAGLLESLLLFYDCTDEYTRLTNNRGMQTVHSAYLTMLGASTPAAMAQHLTADRLWGIGWWPRFAVLTPDQARPDWREPQERVSSVHLDASLRALYENLPEAEWPEPPAAQTVILGDYVFDLWNSYNKALRYELLNESLDTRLWGTYGRLPVLAIKVAMILAAMDWAQGNGGEVRVELPHLSRALRIAERWRISAHRAILSANEQAADRVATRIMYQVSRLAPEGPSMRDLCKAMKDVKPFRIKAALDELVLAGELSLVERIIGPRGGRPTDRYFLYKEGY